MSDSEEQKSSRTCRYCGGDNVWFFVRTSFDEAFEDECYTCRDCKKSWWIDGIDS
jgi:hypothetical protein